MLNRAAHPLRKASPSARPRQARPASSRYAPALVELSVFTHQRSFAGVASSTSAASLLERGASPRGGARGKRARSAPRAVRSGSRPGSPSSSPACSSSCSSPSSAARRAKWSRIEDIQASVRARSKAKKRVLTSRARTRDVPRASGVEASAYPFAVSPVRSISATSDAASSSSVSPFTSSSTSSNLRALATTHSMYFGTVKSRRRTRCPASPSRSAGRCLGTRARLSSRSSCCGLLPARSPVARVDDGATFDLLGREGR